MNQTQSIAKPDNVSAHLSDAVRIRDVHTAAQSAVSVAGLFSAQALKAADEAEQTRIILEAWPSKKFNTLSENKAGSHDETKIRDIVSKLRGILSQHEIMVASIADGRVQILAVQAALDAGNQGPDSLSDVSLQAVANNQQRLPVLLAAVENLLANEKQLARGVPHLLHQLFGENRLMAAMVLHGHVAIEHAKAPSPHGPWPGNAETDAALSIIASESDRELNPYAIPETFAQLFDLVKRCTDEADMLLGELELLKGEFQDGVIPVRQHGWAQIQNGKACFTGVAHEAVYRPSKSHPHGILACGRCPIQDF
jgi:hypothetical protein